MQNRIKTHKFFGSIRTRMVAVYLSVTLLAMIAISLTVSAIVEGFLVSQRVQTQQEETTRLALEIAPEIVSFDAEQIYEIISERAQSMGGRVLILDTDAVVQADSASRQNGTRLPYREVRDVLIGEQEASYGFHKIYSDDSDEKRWVVGESYVWAVYYTAPITDNGVYVGAIMFSSLIQDVEESVENVATQTTYVFVGVAAVIVTLTFIFSAWLTKPIVELTGAIRKMGRQTDKNVKVKIAGSSEIEELGVAFNRMSEQISDHDRVRDEFVSNASHELKTPLSTMKILSESIMYEKNPDPKIVMEFFSDVNHEVDRLSRVITDLLRLVQYDAVDSEPEFGDIELDVLIKRVADRVKPLADKKNIDLSVAAEPLIIKGEALRLEQMAVNLIENAIKYTDEGSVKVTLLRDESEAVFSVRDTGMGIPEESIAHLFERFYRVDKARSRGTGGTGLGLAIVEKIIAMHGGTIEVESVIDEGSTFTVRLPLDGDVENVQ